jgi:hypothetical protein
MVVGMVVRWHGGMGSRRDEGRTEIYLSLTSDISIYSVIHITAHLFLYHLALTSVHSRHAIISF